jgi:DNA modification methylase
MKTETTQISTLTMDPSNVRKHSERNLDSIRASLNRFGQQKPIVVNADGVVIAGNGTLAAAKSLGWKEVSVVRTDLNGAEAIAYAIADNRTAELAEWDDAALAETLAALQNDDSIDHLTTGFTDAEIAKIIDEVTGMDAEDVVEDEVPEVPVDPVTKPGDLWVLGDHRLLCGDSTKAEDVERLMAGAEADTTVTDPPYGVNYVALRGGNKIANDESLDSAERVMQSALLSSPKDAAFVCCNWRSMAATERAMRSAGMEPKACIVWDKERGVQNLDRYYKRHEFLLYAGPYGGQKTVDGDVWAVPRDFDPDHPTPKPVKLFVRAMTTSNAQAVYDPFLGSGTTLIAAEQLGRKCYGMEISPAYCDVIVKRWENLTGKTAAREEHV